MQVITEGLRVPEGPVVMDDGSVLVVEVMGGTLVRVRPDGSTHVVAQLGGGPNGAAIGPDGAVYVCNNGGLDITWTEGRITSFGRAEAYAAGAIQRVDLATGRFEVLYDACDGLPLSAPNDIVFDHTGGFWFTDSGHRLPEHKQWGALYYARADGSYIVCIRNQLMLPNGVGLSPDQGTVYVADSVNFSVWGCELASPGMLKPGIAAGVQGRLVGRQGELAGLDSLAVEADGRICVASSPRRIAVMIPDGGLENVHCPDPMPTNLCFGGDDMRDVWITAGSSGALLKTRWPRPGARLSYYA